MSDEAASSTVPSPEGLLSWEWSRGGRAQVMRVDGAFVTVHSTAAFPPGAPLTAVAKGGHQFEMKVRGCRKLSLQPDTFEIDGKLFNLSKESREHLRAAADSLLLQHGADA